jgi:hypothetical protein
VGVHSKCNPLSQAEGDYVCYCCDKEVVEEQQLCAVCGCVGGLMFPTQLQSDDELLDGRFALPLVYSNICILVRIGGDGLADTHQDCKDTQHFVPEIQRPYPRKLFEMAQLTFLR